MNKATIIISGALANKPFNGGNAWTRLSWVLGLKKAGFDVCFVEQISRNNCVDMAGGTTTFEKSANLDYFRSVMDVFGLSQSSALICDGGESVYGLKMAQLLAVARESPLLFNISGHLTLPELKSAAKCKVYYDDDPGFTQFWHAAGDPGPHLDDHDFHFTIGSNIGKSGCEIPTGDIRWKHTRPPVVLEDWPRSMQQPFDRFTTVASWRGAYAPIQYEGKSYGVKAHEFRKFMELPSRCGSRFEIALDIHQGDKRDLDNLLSHGWHVVEPKRVAGSPDAFRRYVQASGAEFSVAQAVYVQTNSGWFSDRTVRYLASGRPVLVQDTGFSQHYPVGEGLLAFRTLDEAIEGAERIRREYEKHCRAARALGEEYFDSDKVIRTLLSEIGFSVRPADHRSAGWDG